MSGLSVEERLAVLERREAERTRAEVTRRRFGVAGLVVAAVMATVTYAAVPHTFAADTPALAGQVNANFVDLDTRVTSLSNALDAGVTSLNAALTARIPAGTIAFFASSSCPTGWTEATALRGRALVGVPQGGTVLGTVGTALTNLQNPTHGHEWANIDSALVWRSFDSSGASVDAMDWGDGMDSDGSGEYPFSTSSGSFTFYTSRSSANVPYVQLLGCSKQ